MICTYIIQYSLKYKDQFSLITEDKKKGGQMYEYSGRDPRGHLRGHLEDTPEDTQDDTQRTTRRTFPLSSEGQTELYPKISLLGYDD